MHETQLVHEVLADELVRWKPVLAAHGINVDRRDGQLLFSDERYGVTIDQIREGHPEGIAPQQFVYHIIRQAVMTIINKRISDAVGEPPRR